MIRTTIGDLLRGRFTYTDEKNITRSCDVISDTVADDSDDPEACFREHRVYLFRDKETVFYVGQSKNVLSRVRTHLDLNAYSGTSSPLWAFFRVNLPQSYNWMVEFYTLDDCKTMYWKIRGERIEQIAKSLHEHIEKKYGRGYKETFVFSADTAERFLISGYRPCLNIAYNSHPSKIPATFRLPVCEIPDGIVCSMNRPLTPFTVTYQAYDYQTQQNKDYTVTMYGRKEYECYQMAFRLLGYKPDNLYAKETYRSPF